MTPDPEDAGRAVGKTATLIWQDPARLALALFVLVAGFAALLAFGGSGGDREMTATEREELRTEVRAYLLENPGVLMEAMAVLEEREAEAQVEADRARIAENEAEIFDDGRSWIGGNPEGDVTLVEFLDYRCGYCRRAHPEIAALLEGDGDIRLIVKEFPILGEQSLLASRFAVATRRVAGDEAYKAAHDRLITMRAAVTPASLQAVAEEIGVDAAAVMAEMDSEAVTAELRANRALGQRLEISGTPSFIVGDELLRGYLPMEAMQEMVEEVRG